MPDQEAAAPEPTATTGSSAPSTPEPSTPGPGASPPEASTPAADESSPSPSPESGSKKGMGSELQDAFNKMREQQQEASKKEEQKDKSNDTWAKGQSRNADALLETVVKPVSEMGGELAIKGAHALAEKMSQQVPLTPAPDTAALASQQADVTQSAAASQPATPAETPSTTPEGPSSETAPQMN